MSETRTAEKELLNAAAKMFEKYGLTEIKLKSGDNEVYFKKETTPPMGAYPPMPPMGQPQYINESVSAQVTASDRSASANVTVNAAAGESNASNVSNASNTSELKSPLLGIFYSSPDPSSDPFVKVGDKVKQGDVLCIVEAMKMMNEICAECDGTVAEICAENGDMVEYNQTLFKIRA